jgi:hypothetical protein
MAVTREHSADLSSLLAWLRKRLSILCIEHNDFEMALRCSTHCLIFSEKDAALKESCREDEEYLQLLRHSIKTLK